MNSVRLLAIALLSLTAVVTTGCDPWYSWDDSSSGYCAEYAVDEYEVCDVYCDFWGCWDECYYSYDEYCIDYVVEYDDHHHGNGGVADDCECATDYDCRRGETCDSDGYCVEREREEPNPAQLCEPCAEHTDCAGDDSLCVVFGDDNSGYCGNACQRDRDCPSAYECVRTESTSQCVPKSRTCEASGGPTGPTPIYECDNAQDCDSDEICVDGDCVIEESECQRNRDCAASEVCMNGECVGEDIESCSFNSDCTDEALCIDGMCRDYCTTDAACGSDEVCRGGVCSPRPDAECTTGNDCGNGDFICVDGQCRDQCSRNADCAAGTECLAGYCEFVDIECRTNADCGDDQACIDGGCFFTCRASCSCPEGMLCDDDAGVCTNAPAPDECEVNCDCPSGQYCSEGECVANPAQ